MVQLKNNNNLKNQQISFTKYILDTTEAHVSLYKINASRSGWRFPLDLTIDKVKCKW